MQIEIRNDADIKHVADVLTKKIKTALKGLLVEIKKATRTNKQSSALFSTLGEWVKKLNEAGYTYKVQMGGKVFKRDFAKPALHQYFKDLIKREYDYDSTKQLSTTEISDAYDKFNEEFSKVYQGIYVEYHSNKEPTMGEK